MAGNTLKFQIKFYLGKEDSVNRVRDYVISFFQNCHESIKNHKAEVSMAEKILIGCSYEENIYQLNVSVTYLEIKQDSDLDCNVSEICRKWCEEKDDRSFFWLVPVCNERFYYEENRFDSHMKTSEFAFGTLPDMVHFVQHYHYVEKRPKSEIMTSFFHTQKYFCIYFTPVHNKQCTEEPVSYIFHVKYQSVVRVIVNNSDTLATQLLFQLDYPPIVYSRLVSDLVGISDRAKTISDASMLQYCPEKCERALYFGCECSKSKCYIRRNGRSPILKLSICDKYRVRHVIHRLKQRCDPKMEISYCGIQTLKFAITTSLKTFTHFPLSDFKYVGKFKMLSEIDAFNIQYSWMSMFCQSLFIRDQIFVLQKHDPNIICTISKKLLLYSLEDVSALVETLFEISDYIRKSMLFVFPDALSQLFNRFHDLKLSIDLPPGMCLARRIVVTPSRVIYLPPTEHFDNRVIRTFGTEYMLRISVQDGNSSKLTYSIQYNSKCEEFMQSTVGNLLFHGITIGKRHYEVLASSNSQLREHGLWLCAKDKNGNTAADIREWMGDFAHIRNVAKYMARMGQCFSTSEQAVQLAVDGRDEIMLKDIKTPTGSYVFSDGIGTISSSLASEVRTALKKVSDISSYEPSAFQIRYKGCKGMVVEDPRMKGRKLGIRPSMRKFDCDTSNCLEIVKISAPRKLFLNRMLITILEQLGISSDVFMKLQKNMILQLVESLISEWEAASRLAYFLSSYFPYKKLQDAGISLINEPFFRSLLLCIYKTSVEQLRSKGRISIPPEYGRNMLGVLDETKTLRYGQVFVQYSENTELINSSVTVLKGTVVVTKNPCVHPGDVRKFQAVDDPHLRHIKDCIVFPACGKRPHPDEMAGSDLDGDEYVVIWLPELIFSQKNYPPMVYPKYKEEISSNEIEVGEMVDFFCKYIQNDNIGVFANAHLAWADQHPDGIFSKVCMSIAKKFPYVLDFAKTGMTHVLAKGERPHKYPDFMEKHSMSNSYCSMRALGLLYRTSRHLEACVGHINTIPYASECDVYLSYPGWESYEQLAEMRKLTYVLQMEHILNRFGARSEAEVLCSCLEGQLYNQTRGEKNNIESIVKVYVIDLMKKYRHVFLDDLKQEVKDKKLCPKETEETKLKMASAWYMVVYRTSTSKMLSFPWIVSDYLAEVRLECLKVQGKLSSDVNHYVWGKMNDSSFWGDFNALAQEDTVNEECKCITVGKSILKNWLIKTDLISSDMLGSESCSKCLERICSYYFSHADRPCCSFDVVGCTCSVSCSSLKLIILMLKFYMSDINYSIGTCTGSCGGFLVTNLQSVALQTLANLSITRKLKYLCVPCEDGADDCEENSNLYDLESDVIRIPVKTDEDKMFFANFMAEIKKYLKKQSGVKEIYIEPEEDTSQNWYLLVSSVGRSFQRWNLEDLVLNPSFIQKLKAALQIN